MSRFEPTLLLTWTMLTAAFVFGELGGPVRVIFALTFLCAAPGLAVTRLLGFRDLEMRLLVAVPTSLAITAVVSGALVYFGVPSWDLGLSILLSLTVAAVIADLARPELGLGRLQELQLPGKLDDETRQARMVDALQAGGTLADAAEAAGVSRSTLYRSLRRSEALRRAVEVASRGTVDLDLIAGTNDPHTPKDGGISS